MDEENKYLVDMDPFRVSFSRKTVLVQYGALTHEAVIKSSRFSFV